MKPTEYIAGDRRGRAAHDLELEAMRDPFLAEALEGLEAVEGDHTAAIRELRQRIGARTGRSAGAPKRRIWPRIAAAAAILAILTTGLLTWHRPAPDPASSPRLAAGEPAESLRQKNEYSEVPTQPVTVTEESRPSTATPTTDDSKPRSGSASDAKTQQSTADTTTRSEIDFDEVVVVAYGSQKMESFTGAVTGIDPGTSPEAGSTDDLGYADRTPASNTYADARTEEPHPADPGYTDDVPASADKEDTIPPADTSFASAETMPSFQGGGLETFRQWVEERLRKPDMPVLASGIENYRVGLTFTIETDGRLTDVRVVQSASRALSDEALRVVKSSPRWSPGRQGDSTVRVRFTLLVDFRKRN